MTSKAKVAHLPALVPKDWLGARVHQVRFSICREEVQDVWQDRMAPERSVKERSSETEVCTRKG